MSNHSPTDLVHRARAQGPAVDFVISALREGPLADVRTRYESEPASEATRQRVLEIRRIIDFLAEGVYRE